MTDYYARSGATGSAAGTSWADAYVSLLTPTLGDGDRLFVAHDHAESDNSSAYALSGSTSGKPAEILCVNDSANYASDSHGVPTTLATGATVTQTSATASKFNFLENLYCYGLEFLTASAVVNQSFNFVVSTTNRSMVFVAESCTFNLRAMGSQATMGFGNASNLTVARECLLLNCSVVTASAFNFFTAIGQGNFRWVGGSWTGAAFRNGLFRKSINGRGGSVLLSGVDLSAIGTSALFDNAQNYANRFIAKNCRVAANWAISTGAHFTRQRNEAWNCDSGDTNYRLWIDDWAGSVKSETTIVRTSGASDGDTPLSWVMASSAAATFPTGPLRSPPIWAFNATTGSAITLTVELVTDNVTLTDRECWLEVEYLGTSGYPLGVFATGAKNVLATAANLATSTVDWTTTGLTTPAKQKVSVTFTPQEKGYLQVVVGLAKASTTVYVDPLVVVS